MDLTPKEKAERRRKIADALDAVADLYSPEQIETARTFRAAAEANRREANEIDPPQPEWQAGDLARDRDGDLWQFDGDEWCHLHGMERSTAGLIRDYGPIRKVRVADPARHEVVVSLDGLDREELDLWSPSQESNYRASTHRAAIRVAKAAREQLGEVQ